MDLGENSTTDYSNIGWFVATNECSNTVVERTLNTGRCLRPLIQQDTGRWWPVESLHERLTTKMFLCVNLSHWNLHYKSVVPSAGSCLPPCLWWHLCWRIQKQIGSVDISIWNSKRTMNHKIWKEMDFQMQLFYLNVQIQLSEYRRFDFDIVFILILSLDHIQRDCGNCFSC